MFWTSQVDGGPKRVNHASVVVKDYIYCFGGFCNGENYKRRRPMDVHILNPENLKWFAVPLPKINDPQTDQIPYQRYGHTAVNYEDKVIIWGGRNDRSACNQLFSFDTNTFKWRKLKQNGALPGARDGHSACIIGHRMYIFGGFEEYLDKFSNDIHCFDFITSKWSYIYSLNDPPSYRDFHTATAIDHKIYIFGGRSDYHAPYHSQEEYYNNEIMYFDTITYRWNKPITTGQIPLGRRSHSAFTYKNNMYIFGGYNGELKRHFNDLYKFSYENNEWTEMKPKGIKPCGRRRQCCCIVKDKLYMFGGTSPDMSSNSGFMSDYSDSDHESRLIDHGDLYVLDFAPTLKTLCLIVVSHHNLQEEWLPEHLKLEIKRMKKSYN